MDLPICAVCVDGHRNITKLINSSWYAALDHATYVCRRRRRISQKWSVGCYRQGTRHQRLQSCIQATSMVMQSRRRCCGHRCLCSAMVATASSTGAQCLPFHHADSRTHGCCTLRKEVVVRWRSSFSKQLANNQPGSERLMAREAPQSGATVCTNPTCSAIRRDLGAYVMLFINPPILYIV